MTGGLSCRLTGGRAPVLLGGAIIGLLAAGCGELLGGGKSPQITALAPIEARSGDTILLRGSGFDPTAEKNTVLIGDRRGRVVTAARDLLSVEVPTVTFLGDDVTRVGVRVRVADRESNVLPLDVHSPDVARATPPSFVPEAPELAETPEVPSPPPAAGPRRLAQADPRPAPASGSEPRRVAGPPTKGARSTPPTRTRPGAPPRAAPEQPDEAKEPSDEGSSLEPGDAAVGSGSEEAEAPAPPAKAFVAGETKVRGRAASGSGLAGFDMGGVQLKQATLEGRVQFEVAPQVVQADGAFRVKVFLENLATEPLRLKELRTTTVVDGKRSARTLKLDSEVGPRTRAMLAELPGTWSGATEAWTMEVLVVTREGDIYSNQLTWK